MNKRHIYFFQREFIPQILKGDKRQTFRPDRKRMPIPGDVADLRMWEGIPYRSPQILIGDAEITRVVPMRVKPKYKYIFSRFSSNRIPNLLNFAEDDGFKTPDDFFDFFKKNYPQKETIIGFATYFIPLWDLSQFPRGDYCIRDRKITSPKLGGF